MQPIDNATIDTQMTIFLEIFCFTQYRDDCITIWTYGHSVHPLPLHSVGAGGGWGGGRGEPPSKFSKMGEQGLNF